MWQNERRTFKVEVVPVESSNDLALSCRNSTEFFSRNDCSIDSCDLFPLTDLLQISYRSLTKIFTDLFDRSL
jgi:hypothetical protein